MVRPITILRPLIVNSSLLRAAQVLRKSPPTSRRRHGGRRPAEPVQYLILGSIKALMMSMMMLTPATIRAKTVTMPWTEG